MVVYINLNVSVTSIVTNNVTIKSTIKVTVKEKLNVTVRVMRHIIFKDASNVYKILLRFQQRRTKNCQGPCNVLVLSVRY